jgi:transmembrane sensor
MDRKDKDIESLIIASLTQKISADDKKLLDQWLKESPENLEQFEIIKKVWQERSQDRKFINDNEVLERIWNKAHHTDYAPQKVKAFNLSLFMKIAATLLILFAATYLFINKTKNSIDSSVVEANLIIKGNPAGQKSRITLSDGSIVWLNSASSISFLEKFPPDARNITLEGEAFFEVTQDTLRPFVVTTGNVSTTALGTSFNINAFDAENIKIALITGKVKVVNESHHEQPYFLNPGMGLIFKGNEEAHG